MNTYIYIQVVISIGRICLSPVSKRVTLQIIYSIIMEICLYMVALYQVFLYALLTSHTIIKKIK